MGLLPTAGAFVDIFRHNALMNNHRSFTTIFLNVTQGVIVAFSVLYVHMKDMFDSENFLSIEDFSLLCAN